MKKNDSGYVYILTNPAFKEDWVKIGKTSGSVEKRMEELFTTALPTRFELYAWCKTSKYNELEKQAHHILDKLTDSRIDDKREFFQLVPSEALAVLRELAATIDDAEFYVPSEQGQTQRATPAPPFRFSMVHLAPGAELVFEPTGARVTVIEDKSDNKIVFDGIKYTLTGFCKKFMPANKRNKKDTYQGPHYFSYEGKLLVSLRAKYEKES